MQALSPYVNALSWRARQAHPLWFWTTTNCWLFFLLQFVLASNLLYAWWFYLAVGLPLLTLFVEQRRLVVLMMHNRLLRLCMVLWAYTLMHTFVLLPDQIQQSDTLRHSCATFLFLLAGVLMWQLPGRQLLRWCEMAVCFALVTAIIAIIWHITQFDLSTRLEAFGQNDHAILGANIYGMTALMVFVLLRSDTNSVLPNGLLYATIIITGVLIVLTQSRGPLISYVLAVGFGLWMTGHRRLILVSLITAGLVSIDFWLFVASGANILPLDNLYALVFDMMGRESHRLGIWQKAHTLIAERWQFGYGMQAGFPYGFGGVNPHNLFLSAWYYTGAMGAAILVVIAGIALMRAVMIRRTPWGLLACLWMIHAICACITDQGQYVNSPSPLWSIFWLPVALVIARTSKNHYAQCACKPGVSEL